MLTHEHTCAAGVSVSEEERLHVSMMCASSFVPGSFSDTLAPAEPVSHTQKLARQIPNSDQTDTCTRPTPTGT